MERRKQTLENAPSISRVMIMTMITIAFLSITSTKAYCVNPTTPLMPELVLENDTVDNPEQAPQFPGGIKELMELLYIKLETKGLTSYGHSAGVRIIVQFIIDQEGNVIKPRIKKSVDPILDKEALRIVSQLPRWQPGMQDGKPVMTRFTVPIGFRYY